MLGGLLRFKVKSAARPHRVPFGFDAAPGSARDRLDPRRRDPPGRAGSHPMSAVCEEAAEQVTRNLGFDCHDVSPVISVHNPFDLANGTMPMLELVIIAGAVWALVHAVRRLRAGDPINLAIWCASADLPVRHRAAAVLPGVVRPGRAVRLHLRPQHLHRAVHVGPAAALHHRDLPGAESSWSTRWSGCSGCSSHRGALVGSILVAFVCQVFYEIFDQLGPQLKWWGWNDANTDVNHPALASVPMNSMLLFASVSFGVMTFLAIKLAGSKARRRWTSPRMVAGLADRGRRRTDAAVDGAVRHPVRACSAARRPTSPRRPGSSGSSSAWSGWPASGS